MSRLFSIWIGVGALEPIKSTVEVNSSKISAHELGIATCLKKIANLEDQLAADKNIVADLLKLRPAITSNIPAIESINERLDSSLEISDMRLNDKFDRIDKLSRSNNLTLAGVPVKQDEDLPQFY